MLDDKDITLQIIGSLIKNPNLLNKTDKYNLSTADFGSQFERKIFAAIYNLHEQGAKNLGIIDIDNFFKNSAASYSTWEKERGYDYLQDAEELSIVENFDYYYNKLKKINLLKSLKKNGYDISKFYEEDTLNPKYQEINSKFEELTPNDIIKILRKDISQISRDIGISQENKVANANSNIVELFNGLKIAPDTGARLQGDYFNTIVRGARKGKFYLRSAASGVGKSRGMVGDACYLAYPIRYNSEINAWDWCGAMERVLYIATEQELDEIQTMILAYISDVNEDKILYASYNDDEEERIKKAIYIMDLYKDNLKICQISNPNIEQVQSVIREEVLENNIDSVFYDYIFSNPALMNEFRDLKVADHQALGMFSAALKDLAVELNIFLMSATQVNAKEEETTRAIKNESVIRGARSIVDKVDMGCVCARPTLEELHQLETVTSIIPNLVTDIYKMRRGRYTQVRIWSFQDLGTCRKKDLFVSTAKIDQEVKIDTLKQVYMEDKTSAIYSQLDYLNNIKEIDMPTDEGLLLLNNKLEEGKNDPFFGLL